MYLLDTNKLSELIRRIANTSHFSRITGLRVENCYLADVQRHLLLDNPASLTTHRVGALMSLHFVCAFDDQVLGVDHPQYGTPLALVLTSGDDYIVALRE